MDDMRVVSTVTDITNVREERPTQRTVHERCDSMGGGVSLPHNMFVTVQLWCKHKQNTKLLVFLIELSSPPSD